MFKIKMDESILFLEELYKSLYDSDLKLKKDKKLEKLIEMYKSDILYFNNKANDISIKHKYEWFNKTPFANLFINLYMKNIIDNLKEEFNRDTDITLDELRDEINFNINYKLENFEDNVNYTINQKINELKNNIINKKAKWEMFDFCLQIPLYLILNHFIFYSIYQFLF